MTIEDLKTFTCPTCGQGFTQKGNMEEHMTSQHSETPKQPLGWAPQSLDQTFNNGQLSHGHTTAAPLIWAEVKFVIRWISTEIEGKLLEDYMS
jgi:hypothetical protein